MKKFCEKAILGAAMILCGTLAACSDNGSQNYGKQDATEVERIYDVTEKPRATFCSDKILYSLLELSIGDSEERAVELYGEPTGRCYEVVGTYPLQDQSLYTYLIYDDKMIVVRKFFDMSGSYDNENGVVEIEISSGEYTTTEGIKIGDSVENVKEKYGIEYVYDYGENDGLVSTLIYERVEGIRDIMNREFSYDYGNFDGVAYVLSDEKFDDHNSIPAIIFLICERKVTRIIMMNTVDF